MFVLWYLRTQYILGKELQQRSTKQGAWKKAYYYYANGIISRCRIPNSLVVEIQLEVGADPSDYNNACIRHAAMKGHTVLVKTLLSDPRVDPTVWRNQPIRQASIRGHLEVVKLLLTNKNVDPEDGLIGAVAHRQVAIVGLLLQDKRVSLKEVQRVFSNLCSMSGGCVEVTRRELGKVEIIKLLLADPRINTTASHDRAFRRACRGECTDIVRLLLADGTEHGEVRAIASRVSDEACRSEFYYASTHGHTEIMKLLQGHGEEKSSIDVDKVARIVLLGCGILVAVTCIAKYVTKT